MNKSILNSRHAARRKESVSKANTVDFSQSRSSPVDRITFFHSAIGNRAVERLFKSGRIQAKLKIGAPNDTYEQEADRVAEQVMRMPDNLSLPLSRSVPAIQKEEDRTTAPPPAAEKEKPDNAKISAQTPEPDFLKLRSPFLERNAYNLWDPNSALSVWKYNFDFFKRLGLKDTLAGKATNLTAPFAIDAQLKATNPKWWEITDRELKTTSITLSIPLLGFDSGFKSWKPLPFLQKKPVEISSDEMTENQRAGEKQQPLSGRALTLLSGGQPLDSCLRTYFEPRFGSDFSGVRVHKGTRASESARSINARAFTLGNNVVFGAGEYQPNTMNGKRLIAHELTHVVQQGGTIPRRKNARLSVQQSTSDRMIQGDFKSFTASAKRGWNMYSGLTDEGAPFAKELMRWRMIGLGMDFHKDAADRDWNRFMANRPEIQRAMASRFATKAVEFSAGGLTGNRWMGGWKYFNDSITGVRLNELESMRLTLHGCHRIDIRGSYNVSEENGVRVVRLGIVSMTWVDRADLHPGTGTELASGAMVDDREFTSAGWDYDIRITFEMPSTSTWRVKEGKAEHIRGWPPEAGVPAAGFRG